MIIYKVHGKNSEEYGVTRFAGSRAKASEIRNDLIAEHGGKKSAWTITEADLSTKKYELLEFINDLCKTKEDGD